MALQDLISKNKKLLTRGPGGQLTEETQEEVQNLAGQAGLQAPPTGAIGTAMIGGNANQQKMAGTPNQMQAAINLSTQPSQDLATAQRQQQARTQATAGEQASMQKSENLKSLGGLGDRVATFINAQKQALTAAAPVQAASVDQFQGRDVSAVKPLLDQLRADPSNMQLMLQVNQALGYDVNRQLSPEEINNLYGTAVESIAKGAAGNVDNDLTVSDLVAQGDLGYSASELSSLLGVPEAELNSMSVGGIRSRINQLQADEFNKSAELQQKATSGQLGVAERGLARQAGREASATGVRASEADVQNLEQQIANADQVQFGGQSYKVDDLLKDDTISGIVSDYLNSAEGSPLRQQINQSEPALSEFISKNKILLEDAAKQLSGSAGQFQEIQQANKQLSNLGGVELDPTIAKSLIPGVGELSAQKIDPNSVPILKLANQAGPDGAKQLASQINQQAVKDPEFAAELGKLSENQLRELNIAGGGEKWNNYVKAAEQFKQAQQASDPDEIMSLIIAGTGGLKDAQDRLSQDYAMSTITGRGSLDKDAIHLIDSDGDGKIDNPDQLKQSLEQAVGAGRGKPSLVDFSSGVGKPYSPPALGQPAALDGNAASVSSKLNKAASDGKVDAKDLSNAKLNYGELEWLLKNSKRGNVDRKALEGQVDKWRDDTANSYIAQINSKANRNMPLTDAMDTLRKALKDEGRAINKDKIHDQLDRLEFLVYKGYGSMADTGQIKSNVGQAIVPVDEGQEYKQWLERKYGGPGELPDYSNLITR